jgi:hypothetical protein
MGSPSGIDNYQYGSQSPRMPPSRVGDLRLNYWKKGGSEGTRTRYGRETLDGHLRLVGNQPTLASSLRVW